MSGEDNSKVIDFNGKVLTEEEITERVLELRKLVLDDNILKSFRTDESYLLRFVHCTNFNVPAAYKRMQAFSNLLLEHPDWFSSTSPLENKHQIDKKTKAILRERDRQGRPVYLYKIGKVDASTSSPQVEAQLDEIWFESVLDEPKAQMNGISVIMDMEGYSWKMFKWLTPLNLKVGSTKADLFPCKEIVYHIVNTSFLFNASIKLAWPFLSNKIKETIKFHFENWPSLHEFVDPKILPSTYGGTGPDVDFEKLNQWLYDRDAKIGERLKYQRVDKK